MRRRAPILCVMLLPAFAAQSGTPVAAIVAAVREGIARHVSDGALARSLHKLRPAEHLDEHAVEELESAGAGPKAVAELERLREASRGLPPPAAPLPFRHEAMPPPAEQQRLVNAAQTVALRYSGSLPDFLCNETIRRYDDSRGWTLKDTLEVRLGYVEGRENYRLLTVNGRMNSRPLESIGGAVSEGEFGSMLLSIFSPKSHTVFRWDHWTTIRRRPAHVFSFRTAAENSDYRMQYRSGPSDTAETVAGRHGFVYIDRDTQQILRIIADSDIPSEFPVRESSTMLDYDFTKIGGREFLLPLRADVRMATSRLHTRNLVEFHDYRKFAGESTITFH